MAEASSTGRPAHAMWSADAPDRHVALTSQEARAALQVQPDPVAAIRRPGGDPYRILLFGGGVLQGIGLADHEVGLPGLIADAVRDQRSRGVRLDVVVEAHPVSGAALSGLSGLRLRRYDAVVVVLAEQDPAHPSETEWRGALVALVKLLMTETCACAGLFVYDSTRASAHVAAIPPTPRAAAAAERLSRISEEVCAISGRVRFAELPDPVLPADVRTGFGDGTLADWSGWIAERLVPALVAVDRSADEDTPRRFRAKVQDERFRQRAVDALRLRRDDRDEHVEREIRHAKLLYRADLAALNIVDRDAVWSRATGGAAASVLPRSLAFCSIGVQADGLLLINDTWRDPRTAGNPLTTGPAGVRFYAGFPVRTWDGYRIGMVCVLGLAPRAMRSSELEGLRDAAARVEQTLWRQVLKPERR